MAVYIRGDGELIIGKGDVLAELQGLLLHVPGLDQAAVHIMPGLALALRDDTRQHLSLAALVDGGQIIIVHPAILQMGGTLASVRVEAVLYPRVLPLIRLVAPGHQDVRTVHALGAEMLFQHFLRYPIGNLLLPDLPQKTVYGQPLSALRRGDEARRGDHAVLAHCQHIGLVADRAVPAVQMADAACPHAELHLYLSSVIFDFPIVQIFPDLI